MRKILLTISISVLFAACSPSNKLSNNSVYYQIDQSELINELNASILDGFFDNDPTKVPEGTYFIKQVNQSFPDSISINKK